MILVDHQIKSLKFVTPFNEELVNPSSLDLRIGETACRLVPDKNQLAVPEYFSFKEYTKENPYYLPPNDFLLIGTLESIKLYDGYSGKVLLKSSRAREGLSHSLAGWVEEGFEGILTLELKNYLPNCKIPIWYGMKIVQVIFFEHLASDRDYIARGGRYAKAGGVLSSLDQFSSLGK